MAPNPALQEGGGEMGKEEEKRQKRREEGRRELSSKSMRPQAYSESSATDRNNERPGPSLHLLGCMGQEGLK